MLSLKQTFCSIILSICFIVNALALPDLTVTTFSINKTNISRGDYFIATATIKNIGNQTSVASFASINIEGIKFARIATKSLTANESATLQYVFPIPEFSVGGEHSVTLEVDFANLVAESNRLVVS
jgi:subtilase family serine protease